MKKLDKIVLFLACSLILMHKNMQTIVAQPSQEITVENFNSIEALPKEIQKKIIKLNAQAANAHQAAFEAHETAEVKEREALELNKDIGSLTQKINELVPKITLLEQKNADTLALIALTTKELADQKEHALAQATVFAEKSEQAAQLKEALTQKIADAAAQKKALEDAEKEKVQAAQTAKDAQTKKLIADKLVELAQNQKTLADSVKEKADVAVKSENSTQHKLIDQAQLMVKDLNNKLSQVAQAHQNADNPLLGTTSAAQTKEDTVDFIALKALNEIQEAIRNETQITANNFSAQIKIDYWDALIKNLNQAYLAYQTATQLPQTDESAKKIDSFKSTLLDLRKKIATLFEDLYKKIIQTKDRKLLDLFKIMNDEWMNHKLGSPETDYRKAVESLQL